MPRAVKKGDTPSCGIPLSLCGGEGGIRTPGTLIEYDSLANCWFQPLTHLSQCSDSTKKHSFSYLSKAVQRYKHFSYLPTFCTFFFAQDKRISPQTNDYQCKNTMRNFSVQSKISYPTNPSKSPIWMLLPPNFCPPSTIHYTPIRLITAFSLGSICASYSFQKGLISSNLPLSASSTTSINTTDIGNSSNNCTVGEQPSNAAGNHR